MTSLDLLTPPPAGSFSSPEDAHVVGRLVDEFDRQCQAALADRRPLPLPGPYVAQAPTELRPHLRPCLQSVLDQYRDRERPPTAPGFEALEEVGRGGMGVVYKARQLATGRVVALKRLDGGDKERAPRLDALLNLRHPNVVAVEGTICHAGHVYLVMEYIEGGDLHARRDDFLLPRDAGQSETAHRKVRIAGLMRQIAEGLAALHAHLVLHRDIKPRNVLIDRDGQPQVCDFGLMRLLDASDTFTQSDAIVGTWLYMAPEQAITGPGKPPLSVRADIYALGAVLYELLTGHPPFPEEHRNLHVLLARKVSETPAPPEQYNPAVGRDCDLAWICMKCLQLEPANRFASAEELVRALSAYERGERVRPDETLWRMVSRLVDPLRRPPADPHYLERWWPCLLIEAGTSFAAHAGLALLAWYQAPGAAAWAMFFLGSLLLGWLIWMPYFSKRRLSPMEQSVAQLWIGADVALAFLFMATVPLFGPVTPAAMAQYIAGASVVRGLAFFIEGRSCWGLLYLPGLAFFASALIMPLVPALAPLIHGTMYSAWFIWLSFQDWRGERAT